MKYVDVVAVEADAKLKWERDPDLRAEFLGDFNLYSAYRKAEARGGTPATKTAPRAGSPGDVNGCAQVDVERQARATWQSDPMTRANFLDESSYVAFKKAEARGAVRILGKPATPAQDSPAVPASAPAKSEKVSASATPGISAEGQSALDRHFAKRNRG